MSTMTITAAGDFAETLISRICWQKNMAKRGFGDQYLLKADIATNALLHWKRLSGNLAADDIQGLEDAYCEMYAFMLAQATHGRGTQCTGAFEVVSHLQRVGVTFP